LGGKKGKYVKGIQKTSLKELGGEKKPKLRFGRSGHGENRDRRRDKGQDTKEKVRQEKKGRVYLRKESCGRKGGRESAEVQKKKKSDEGKRNAGKR